MNFRKRFYRILEATGIEQKGLHSLRHTFATKLVNGTKQADATIRALSPRRVAAWGYPAEQILVFEDEGFSGGNTQRPQFKAMMEGVRAGKIGGVICYRLDRISRNALDFL